MNKLILAVVSLGTLGLVACGGGVLLDMDAPQTDRNGVCNPVTQAGCAAGEKCTFVIDSAAMEPILGTTRCVADGNIAKGEMCTRSVGGTADDCKSGLWCSGGTCEQICSSGSPDSCGADQGQCVHTAGIFEDDAIGFCSPAACDVFKQDCPENEACYILFTRPGAPTVCFPTLADDGQPAPGGQDRLCNYINTCKRGYGCVLPDDPDNFQNLWCAYFCDATASGGPTCNEVDSLHSCQAINGQIFADLPDVPAAIGACVKTSQWATPIDKDPSRLRMRRKRRAGDPK